MKIIDSHTALTTQEPQAIFALWSDPAGWPSWDKEVRKVHFEGPAALGAKGNMRPASGPAAAFSITAYEQGRLFTNASSLPGATLIFEHKLTPTNDGVEVAVSVGVSGALAPLWQRILRKNMTGAARSSVTGLLEHLDAK